MSDVVSSYRLTPADLSRLDPKTRSALMPLIDSLNIVLQQLVKAANSTADVITPLALFTTNDVGAAYVDLLNPLPTNAPPRCVLVANIFRTDSYPVDGGYGFWWTLTESGIRLLFVGLVASTRYKASVRIQ